MKYLLTGEETERLKFRLLLQSDYDEWLPLFPDNDAARFLGMAHLVTPKERCDLWFEKSMARYDNETGGMNVLTDKQTGKMIGQCGLLMQEVEGEWIMEIGYSILPQYWGKGYASEAARKCRDYAFSHGYANELFSIIHPDNHGSAKVAENNGMRFYKPLPDYKGMPVNVYRITREEWERGFGVGL
jgi:ribosomal-protein-alanine N-acetyltransferase